MFPRYRKAESERSRDPGISPSQREEGMGKLSQDGSLRLVMPVPGNPELLLDEVAKAGQLWFCRHGDTEIKRT